jgi:hypothetical protein
MLPLPTGDDPYHVDWAAICQNVTKSPELPSAKILTPPSCATVAAGEPEIEPVPIEVSVDHVLSRVDF